MMQTINQTEITKAVQELVKKGDLTLMGDNLVLHTKKGAFNVGKEADLVTAWNAIQAHLKAE